MAKEPSCSWCKEKGHTQFYCPRKPRKTLSVHKHLNQRGPQTNKWLYTRSKWIKAHKSDTYICHYCRRVLMPNELTLDHMIARSRAPQMRHDMQNLVPACYKCNRLKGSLNHDEYKHDCII